MGPRLWSNGTAAIRNALAIEIVDTYQDGFLGDTSNNEISVHTGGTGECHEEETWSIARMTPPFAVANGAVHTARIQYVPGTLSIYIDDLINPLLVVPYDLFAGGMRLNGAAVGGLDLPQGTAWLGFTSATGAGTLTEDVRILSWNFTGAPLTDPCFAGTVGASAGSPVDVLRVNGSAGDFFRTVTMNTWSSLGITVDAPPGMASAPFALAVDAGAVVAPWASGVGDLCFDPFGPTSFILADAFGGFGGLIPASPAPYQLNFLVGPTVPAEVLLQGVIADSSAPSGLAITNGVRLSVVIGAPPTITLVNPLSAAPGGMVEIRGSDFDAAATVTVAGNAVTATYVDSTLLQFLWPAIVPCDAPLVVRNPDGQTATATLNPTPRRHPHRAYQRYGTRRQPGGLHRQRLCAGHHGDGQRPGGDGDPGDGERGARAHAGGQHRCGDGDHHHAGWLHHHHDLHLPLIWPAPATDRRGPVREVRAPTIAEELGSPF